MVTISLDVVLCTPLTDPENRSGPMREQANKPLEPGQQTREPALLDADDELPYEVLRAIQD